MPQIVILPNATYCPDGAVLEVASGVSVCDALLNNGIDIEHACEKSCACTTCHVIVREGLASLNAADEDEDDMLDKAWGLCSQSRLACQAKLGAVDVVLEIPKYSINHAKEG